MNRLIRKNPEKYAHLVGVSFEAPEELAYLLVWYLEIRHQNSYGWRFEPIPHTEILAYLTLHGLSWDSFDIGMLTQLDAIWRKAQPDPEKTKTPPRGG